MDLHHFPFSSFQNQSARKYTAFLFELLEMDYLRGMKHQVLFQRLFFVLLFVCFQASAFSQTVFISSKGKKYHVENCKILGEDKKGVSVEEAKKQGYKACRKCKVKQIEAIKRKEKEEKKKS